MTNPDFSHCPVISEKCDPKCPGLVAVHICTKIAAKDPGFTRLCISRITGVDPGPFPVTPPSMGVVGKIKSAASSAVRYIASGMANVSDEVYNKRIEICKSCENYIAATNQCKVCSCFLIAKARMAPERCPLKPPKWSEERIEGPGCGGCGSKSK